MTWVDRKPQPLSSILDQLFDARVGIINHIGERRRDAGEPNFFHFWSTACDVRSFGRPMNFATGSAAATTRGRAMAKAIGEAVERYCPALIEIETLPLTSYEKAPFPCVLPHKFALFGPEQYAEPGFPYVPFDAETVVRWGPCVDALTGEDCHVPAVFLLVPYHFDGGDSAIAQPISTGLACHGSVTAAAITAICEVIERDAFTITWQARLARPGIRLETLSPINREIVDRFERVGYSVALLDITTDVGVPTILAVLRGDLPGAVPLTVAAAASLDPEEAALKALEELDHTRSYSHQRLGKGLPPLVPDPTFATVVDQRSHLDFWCHSQHRPFADFLTAAETALDFQAIPNLSANDPDSDLRTLVKRVSATGHRVLLADLTSSDVGELGLAVVRAVIPGFHPLVVGHRARALGGRRLWEVPQRLGYPGLDRETGDNPYPHPYP